MSKTIPVIPPFVRRDPTYVVQPEEPQIIAPEPLPTVITPPIEVVNDPNIEVLSPVIGSRYTLFNDIHSVEECAQMLEELTKRFKYLNGETCKCGKKLSRNYIDSGICRTCSTPPKIQGLCKNCGFTRLRSKWVALGLCSKCADGLDKFQKTNAEKDDEEEEEEAGAA
jgi:hypothetical protein